MSIEKVREFFQKNGVDNRIQEFAVSSATVELAAQALSVEACRIAKTLSFLIGDRCILIVTAGDAKIDNAKFKAAFGCKAKAGARGRVGRTGHAVGGVAVCSPGRRADLSGCLPEAV